MTDPSAIVTPYRRTHVRFDIAEPVVVERPFAMLRTGDEIAAHGATEANGCSNVERTLSGAWRLRTLQEDLQYIHERVDNFVPVLTWDSDTLAPQMQQVSLWRKPVEIPGLTFDPNVSNSGDLFLAPRFSAVQSWNQSSTFAGDVVAFGTAGDPLIRDVPLDRVAVHRTNYPENQGFHFRWHTPGTKLHSPDVLFTYYFGGAVPVGNYVRGKYYNFGGWYAVQIQGNGRAVLWERLANGSEYQWITVESWLYTPPGTTAGASHYMFILPHRDIQRGGGWIEFDSSTTNEAPRSNLGSAVELYVARPSAPTKHIVRIDFRHKPVQQVVPTPPPPPRRTAVTGPGNVRLDYRREQKIMTQVSVLRYHGNGVLQDLPFSLTDYASRRTNLVFSWTAEVFEGTALDGKLYDSYTNAELTLVSSGTGFKKYKINKKQFSYYAKFTMTSDGTRAFSPLLWNYKVTKDGVVDEIDNGEFELELHPRNPTVAKLLGAQTDLSISGPESDMTHETASVLINDLRNELPRLNVRGEFPTQIETEYSQNPTEDPEIRSVLFRGYAVRADAHKRDLGDFEGVGGAGVARLFPSREWRAYNVQMVGFWERLREVLLPKRFIPTEVAPTIITDPSTGSQIKTAKVTDVVRIILQYCGIPDDMLSVPDNPIVLWDPSSVQDFVIEPLSTVIDVAARLLKDYLGWFLLLDPNAGTRGVLRARAATVAPYTNLAEFVTVTPSPGLTTRPETYGSVGWYDTTGNLPTTRVKSFINRHTLNTFVKKPEGNVVTVIGSNGEQGNSAIVSQWAANPKSVNFWAKDDGTPYVTADPDHPDYRGRIVPVFVVDMMLRGQQAVDWATRRYYDLTCHAIKMATFEAPLVLITDPNDALQTRPRPLRYYDPVLIDGAQWLIRNVNPSYSHDTVQLARYECEAPRI